MEKRKILLVEDEEDAREAVYEFLNTRDYLVTCAVDGEQAITYLKENVYDMVLLDIMLPKVNGFVVLNWIRKQSNIPVLMLTAMNDDYTQIMSFEEQADDYITKPFSLLVLEKRIETLFRHTSLIQKSDVWTYKDSKIDFHGYSAYYKDEQVDVTPKEILLLKFLYTYSGKVMSRNQIIDYIWDDEIPMDRVIDTYVKNLRKKLHLDCIVTVKGVGYKYEEQL